jgi:hypothetical protein
VHTVPVLAFQVLVQETIPDTEQTSVLTKAAASGRERRVSLHSKNSVTGTGLVINFSSVAEPEYFCTDPDPENLSSWPFMRAK